MLIEVVLNQVDFTAAKATARVTFARIQTNGVTSLDFMMWRGRHPMRITASSRAATQEDVPRNLAAIADALAEARL